jgi:mitochondrial import receptor subunit TOM40
MGASGSKPTTGNGFSSSPISFFQTPSTRCEGDNKNSPPAPPPPPTSSSDASSSAAPPPPPPSAATSENDNDSIARAAAAAAVMINPGPYEGASSDLKRLVMLDTHDGFRCDINKQLSPYLAVVHSFWLGTNMLPDGRKRTYTWLAQVADESSLVFARIDPSALSVDGRIHKSLLGGMAVAKLQLGLSNEGQNDQCLVDVDLNGMSWSGNLKYGSMGGGPVYGCAFHQGITSRFSMGGEGMYVAANGNMMSNYLLKYAFGGGSSNNTDTTIAAAAADTPATPLTPPNSAICVQYAPSGPSQFPLTLNYKKIVTPKRVTLGAELSCDPMSFASHVVLGAEFKFNRSKLHVTVDGNAKMQSVFETTLGKEPGQPRLSLSAELDHMKDEMKFGYGLAIDG